MTQEQRRQLIGVVGEALRLPASERPAYLRTACGSPAQFEEASGLLAALDGAERFMNAPTAPGAGAGVRAAPAANGAFEAPGATLGRYTLLELIGEGGFGQVFMAEQRDPVVRRVAIKVIRPGMDSRAVIARFEAERQALAMMDHPGIATVFDGGATDSGRPFFAMELVRGVPLTDYCDRARLPIPDRLELFRGVCGAVQHAHQKGVIHRDLKPGNVLVSERDGKAHPKVIDFGIAKATGQPIGPTTPTGQEAGPARVLTELRQIMGTPEYMSPEQALGPAADVDTRADIYSLGVILYELLTGTTPLDRGALRSAGLEGVPRLIRENPTPRPSARLSTLAAAGGAEGAAAVAARRRTEPGRLGLLLKGDLDRIVLKALDKDRARRYDTASALADDVGRFLRHEPVEAAPPSTLYRLRKLARRHRRGVIAGSLVAAAVLMGAAGTAVGAFRAVSERGRATEAASFMTSVLGGVTPGVALGEDTALVRRLLGEASSRLESGEVADPRTEAELRHTIGAAYDEIGAHAAAEPMLRRAVDLRTAALGRDHRLTLESRVALAGVYLHQGRDTEAEAALREALAAAERRLGPRHRLTLDALSTLGVTLEHRGRFAEAEACFTEALRGLTAVAGPDDPATVSAEFNLGFVIDSQGHHAEAEPHLTRVLALRRRTLGADDPLTLTTINAVAGLMGSTGRLDEAEALLAEAHGASRRIFGPDHPSTLAITSNLGACLMEGGKLTEAEPYVREGTEGTRRRLGNDHRETLNAIANLAGLLQSLGRADEADALYREAMEGMRRSPEMGPGHPHTLIIIVTYATFLRDRGRLDEAEPLAREAYDGFARAFEPGTPWVFTASHCLGVVLHMERRHAEAEPFLREAATGRAQALGPAHPRTLNSVAAYATLLADTGRFAEAERELLRVLQEASPEAAGTGAPPPAAAGLVNALVFTYEEWDKAEPGAGHGARAESWRSRRPPSSPPPP